MALLTEVKTGVQQLGPGATGPARGGPTGQAIVSNLGGRYAQSALDGTLFWGANQAAATWSVALATTYTGLCLSNPAGSSKTLVLLKVGFALSAAPAAIASIGLISGFLSTGITAHTTALVPASSVIGGGLNPVGKIDAAATLVGSPAWMTQLMGGFTAAALPATSPALIDLEGSVIVPPGAYVAIGALTAVVGYASMMWEER